MKIHRGKTKGVEHNTWKTVKAYRWVGNVKVDLRKVRCEAENWIEMAKDRVQ
jgi:hypothetical protein